MSDSPPAPRIEAETRPARRLEAEYLPEPVVPRVPGGGVGLVLGGVVVLGLGLLGFAAVSLVTAAFERSPVLGGAAAAIVAAGALLVAWGMARELRGLFALRGVDRLRAELSGTDPIRRQRAALAWLTTLPEAALLLPAVRAANDPDAILALLRAGPGAELRGRAEALGRRAALQSVAGLAAMPSPALAALFVAWRGLRLVREVAALFDMRPGLLGTLALLRRTAVAATAVAGVEMATNAAAHALLSHPLLATVAGDVAGAGLAARRMVVLARAAEAACSPLPPE